MAIREWKKKIRANEYPLLRSDLRPVRADGESNRRVLVIAFTIAQCGEEFFNLEKL